MRTYFLAALCLLWAGMANLFSQTQYTGPAGGDWFTATNWSNGLPANGNDALIGGGASVVIGSGFTVDFTITNFGEITVNGNLNNAGTLANSGTLSFGTASGLTNGGTFQNFGTAAFSATATFVNQNGASFSNTGNLSLLTTLVNKGAITNNGTIDAANGTLQTEGSFNNNQVLTTKTLTIADGSSFTNNFGSELNTTGTGSTLTVNGDFTNFGTLNNGGHCTINGSLANSSLFKNTGTVTVNADAFLNNGNGTIDNAGNFTNQGTLTNGNQFVNSGVVNNYGQFNNNNTIEIKVGGQFHNRTGGSLGMGFGSKILNAGHVNNFAVLNSFGTIENNGTFHNQGTLLSFSGSFIENKNIFRNYGEMNTNDQVVNQLTFVNLGLVNVNGGSLWTNNKTFINRPGATFNVVQDFKNSAGAGVNNQGTFTNLVRVANEGNFVNNAFFENIGDFTNESSATLTNNELFLQLEGNILNKGILKNMDQFLSDDCSSISNDGIINNQSHFNLRGLLFQRGSLAGIPLNIDGGFMKNGSGAATPSLCQNKSFGANIDGEVKVYAPELIAFENFDSCSNITYLADGNDRPVFTCEDVGTIINAHVVLRTRLGDSLTCTAVVTPLDELEPQIEGCPKDRIAFTPNNQINFGWPTPTATDNCTDVNLDATHEPVATFPVGITGVTYTFADAYGNENTCQFRIDVRKTPPVTADCTADDAPPIFEGCPDDIEVSTTDGSAVVGWLPPTVTDDCYPVRLFTNRLPDERFGVGTTIVKYTAFDKNSNSSTCSFKVKVTQLSNCDDDQQPPAIANCPANIYLPLNNVINGAVANWNAPSASDNCQLANLTGDKLAGEIFPAGATTVVYTAEDATGNMATCSFVVTVGDDPCPNDNTPPVISGCPSNISKTTDGSAVKVNWTAPFASDACGPLTMNQNYASGSSFPLGATQVVYQFSDLKGNVSKCTFTINVQSPCSNDSQKPVITNCPSDVAVASVNGQGIATWQPPTATDNCTLIAFSSAYLPGASFPAGVTTVVYKAIDLAGNLSSCEFNVNVVTPPDCTENSAPIEGTTGLNLNNIALSWQTADGADAYDVYLGTSNPPTDKVAANVTGATKTVGGLIGGTKYYWYVVPKNMAGAATGCQSTVNSFTTKTIPCNGCAENLLDNGCFENGLNGFTASAPVEVTTDAYTGNLAGEICTDNHVLRAVVDVTPDLIYDFKGWVKKSNDNTCGTLFFQFKNTSGMIVGSANKSLDQNAWKQYGFSMKAPATAATLTITLKKCSNAGCLRTDEWCITATCANIASAGVISDDQRICEGETAAKITNVTGASGGSSGTVQYSWQKAVTNPNNANSWVNINGAMGANYDPGVLYQNTWFRRGAKRSACSEYLFTDYALVMVLNAPEVSFTKANPNCANGGKGTITFTFADHPGRSAIEFSIDNGQTYLPHVADNSGQFTISDLAPDFYDLWARWGNDDCPVFLGTANLNNNNILPVAKCKDATVELAAVGQAVQIAPAQINNASTAGCGPFQSLQLSTTSFFTPGQFPVTLTVTNAIGLKASCDAVVTVEEPVCDRVSNHLVALYDFKEGGGSVVKDVSGYGTPANLTIAHPNRVSWLNGGCGLSINSATIIKSDAVAVKIGEAIKATQQLTIEAWVKPANTTQDGPARIATYSWDHNVRNFTLGQQDGDYIARLRTTSTSNNGTPNAHASGTVKTALQHVVYTRNGNGAEKIYVDGVVKYTGTRSGDFSPWQNHFHFALGDEMVGGRSWLGEMYLVAVYSRALTASQVAQNFGAGHCCSGAGSPAHASLLGGWEFGCDSETSVEVIGRGIRNQVPVTLQFGETNTIEEVVVEIVYKGSNPGGSIELHDAAGNSYTAFSEQIDNSDAYIYRVSLPSTASVTYSNQTNESSAQSIMAYVARAKRGNSQQYGFYTSVRGYRNAKVLEFGIPAGQEARRVDLKLPISELTDDCRLLHIEASMGGVSKSVTVDGPNLGVGLNLLEMSLENVPANATKLSITLVSPTGSSSSCPVSSSQNGQSYVVAGIVSVDVSCGGIVDCMDKVVGEMSYVFLGQPNANHWYTVNLQNTYVKPAVVMNLNSINDAAPGNVRIRNVGPTSFQFQIDEWDYLDGSHGEERISYMVVESGAHILADGEVIQAGIEEVGNGFKGINFHEAFATNPIVVSNVTSRNDGAAVVSRLRNINPASFEARLQREEGNGVHPVETVSWIAIEPLSIPGCEVGATGDVVTHHLTNIDLTAPFSFPPVLIADMQTYDGGDPSDVRSTDLTSAGFKVKIEEGQANDAEVGHTTENVGYIAFAKGALMGCTTIEDRSSSSLSFNAYLDGGGKVQINWATSRDDETDYYLIEKSMDGENFEPFIERSSQDDGDAVGTYQAVDHDPANGLTHYRLIQTMKDGRLYFSQVETVEVTIVERFRVFPNPAVDFIYVDLSELEGEIVMLRLFDMRGTLLQQWDQIAAQESARLKLPVHSTGQYFLMVYPEGRKPLTKKLILERF